MTKRAQPSTAKRSAAGSRASANAEYFIELADGAQIALPRSESGETEIQAIAASPGLDTTTWRALLWKGDPNRPKEAEWSGTLGIRLPGKDKAPAGCLLSVRYGQEGPPEFSAALVDGTPLPIQVWRGQRGRMEATRLAGAGTPRAAAIPSDASQFSACGFGCNAPPIARCQQCGRPFCADHGQVLPGFLALCDPCVKADTLQIMACASRSGQLEMAVTTITPWAEGANSLPSARTALGLLRAELGDFEGAVSLLRHLSSSASVSDRVTLAQVYLRQAAARVADDDLVAAAEAVAEALSLDSEEPVARLASSELREWQILSRIKSGEFDEAVALWEQDWDRQPFDLALAHHLAILYYQQASLLEGQQEPSGDRAHPADAAWRKVIAHWATILGSPAFWAAWREQRKADAGLELSEEDLDETRKTMSERLLREFRDHSSSYTAAGKTKDARRHGELEVLWGLEQATGPLLKECVQEYRVAGWPAGFACGPLMLERLTATGTGRQAVIDLRKAIPTMQDSMGQKLQRYLSPMARYHFLIEENRLDQAIFELEGVAAWPQAKALLATALCAKGQELAQLSRWEEALATLQKAQDQGADVRPLMAVVADAGIKGAKQILDEDDEDYDNAIRVLEQAIQLVPDHPELRSNLAATYAQKGRVLNNADQFEEAAKLVNLALRYAPDDQQTKHFARVTLANLAASIAEKEPDRAITLLKQALAYEEDEELRGMLLTVLLGRALELAEARNRPRAIALMSDVLRYDPEATAQPTEAEARKRLKTWFFNKAVDAADKDQWAKSVEYAQEARQYVDDSETRRMLASMLYRADRDEEAAQLLRAEVQRNPGDRELRENLAQVLYSRAAQLADQSRLGPAIDLLKEALSHDSDLRIREGLAVLCARAGRLDDAIANWREIIRRKPGDADARHSLCVALHNRGVELANQERFDEGIRYLQEALQIENAQDTRKMVAQALGARAVQKFQRGDRWGAKQDVQEALKYDPHDSSLRQALYNLS